MSHEQKPVEPEEALTERIDINFVLSAANLGVWEMDPITGLVRWDKRCQALFGGTDTKQLAYQEAFQHVHSDDVNQVNQAFEDAMNPQAGGLLELTCRTIGLEDRQLRWVRLTGRAYFSETGKPYRLAGISQEITHQVDQQRRAQQTAQHLQAVLDSSPAIIGFLKPLYGKTQDVVSFELVVGNQRLAQISKKPIDQLLYQPFTQFSHILWQQQTLATLLHVFQTGDPIHREQTERTYQGERWFSIEVTKWDGGLVLTGLDITPLKESQQQLQLGITELEAAKESSDTHQALLVLVEQRADLLRAASHDLRGNLNVLAGVIRLLDTNVQPGECTPPMLELMRRNVRQATRMLTHLLDYVRLEEGQVELKPSLVDVSDLLSDLVKSIKPIALEKGLTVLATGPKRLRAESDALNLNRIGQNLLLTIINKTTQGQLQISWDADPDQNGWWFSVTNTGSDQEPLRDLVEELAGLSGVPIPLEYQGMNRAFTSPGDKKKGRFEEEIGVRIVRQLIILLRAKLRLQREPEGRTKLTVSLPLRY